MVFFSAFILLSCSFIHQHVAIGSSASDKDTCRQEILLKHTSTSLLQKTVLHGTVFDRLADTTNEEAWTTCKREFPKSKRIALLLTGEAFRNTGNQLQRKMCADNTIEPQKRAAQSHFENLVDPLTTLGYEVNIFGSTYPCDRTSMPEELSTFYRGQMTKLSIINRSEQEFGGQVYSYKAAMADAVASGVYDYYLVMRWDLVINAQADLSCAFDGKGAARHLGMLSGFDTEKSWGKFNMDWMLVIPGQLAKCFSLMLDSAPDDCCSSACLGPACAYCADQLNRKSASDIDPVVNTESCPANPIQFSRAVDPVAVPQGDPNPSCKCCHENAKDSKVSGSLNLIDVDYSIYQEEDVCRCS